MNIKDLINEELSQEDIEQQIMFQGKQVLEVVAHPGWQVILSTLAAVKGNIEAERRNGVKNQTSGERALYFSGKVDGFQEAIDEIYNVVKMSQRIKEDRAIRKLQEE